MSNYEAVSIVLQALVAVIAILGLVVAAFEAGKRNK